jgi:hypothetical protein
VWSSGSQIPAKQAPTNAPLLPLLQTVLKLITHLSPTLQAPRPCLLSSLDDFVPQTPVHPRLPDIRCPRCALPYALSAHWCFPIRLPGRPPGPEYLPSPLITRRPPPLPPPLAWERDTHYTCRKVGGQGHQQEGQAQCGAARWGHGHPAAVQGFGVPERSPQRGPLWSSRGAGGERSRDTLRKCAVGSSDSGRSPPPPPPSHAPRGWRRAAPATGPAGCLEGPGPPLPRLHGYGCQPPSRGRGRRPRAEGWRGGDTSCGRREAGRARSPRLAFPCGGGSGGVGEGEQSPAETLKTRRTAAAAFSTVSYRRSTFLDLSTFIYSSPKCN